MIFSAKVRNAMSAAAGDLCICLQCAQVLLPGVRARHQAVPEDPSLPNVQVSLFPPQRCCLPEMRMPHTFSDCVLPVLQGTN